MAEFAEMIEFHSFVSFSFWDQMKWFLFIKVSEMTMKWILKKMMNLFEFHNQSQTEKNVWFPSIYHLIWLFIQLSFIHLSIQTNVMMEKENANNNQTQISYLFEGSYKYVWSHNSFQFDFWLWTSPSPGFKNRI